MKYISLLDLSIIDFLSINRLELLQFNIGNRYIDKRII